MQAHICIIESDYGCGCVHGLHKDYKRTRIIEEQRCSAPWLIGHSHLLTRSVGSILYNGRSVNFPEAQNLCLLTLQSPSDFSPAFWSHVHGIPNYFSIDHPSFHYFIPNTHSGVLNGCMTEKINKLW